MASDLSFVDFIVDQVKDAGQIVSKKCLENMQFIAMVKL